MSSTSHSYIDDGRSFTRRIPPPSLSNAFHWPHTTHGSPSTASVYTCSYVDDGLDLLPTNNNTPGFGPIDPRFYKHKKQRGNNGGVWNNDIAHAVSGDMQRSLAKLNAIAGVEVKRRSIDAKEEKSRSEKKKGVVRVCAPLKWGTFVIKGEDGRVIVVDERGEYDSGVVGRMGEKRKEGRPWVEAKRSASPPVSDAISAVQAPTAGKVSEGKSTKERHSKTHSSSRARTARTARENRRPRVLKPVLESAYDSDDPVKPFAVSPTNFFMTGGLSGWPSPSKPSCTLSPGSPSRALPHAITWETSTSPHTYASPSGQASKPGPKSHSAQTFPHGRPSRAASPTRSVCSSTLTHVKPSSKTTTSHRRSRTRSEPSSRYEYGDQEAASKYQPPDIIEVTYDETPPGEVSYSQAGWNDGKALSAQGWSAAADEENTKGSDLGWDGSAKGSGWEEDEVQSKAGSVHDWGNASKHSNDSSTGWDGFERPKSTSEVSVAGGSERSWPASQHSIHTVQTNRTQRNRMSRRSSRHGPTDWLASRAASQAGSARHSEQDWPASAYGSAHSEHSWPKSRHGSDKSSPTKYQNGFDEDDATYLNETWGGIPVRVASRHKRVAGWD